MPFHHYLLGLPRRRLVAFYSKLQRVTALLSTESKYKALSKTALLELCKCATPCTFAWSKTPHGLKGFNCATTFAALETSRPAVSDLRTARALRSRQVSACSAAMSAIATSSILKDLGFERSSASYLPTDSQGAYVAAKNPINSKLRHVNMQYQCV